MKIDGIIHRDVGGRRTRVLVARIAAILLLIAASALLAPIQSTAVAQQAEPSGSFQPSEYVLGRGDVVSISVFGDEQLSQTMEIGPDGSIAVPLAGQVRAGGRTTAQLSAGIASALSSYIKNPSVTVNVVKFRTTSVVVLGEVVRPGMYELRGDVDLLAAVAAAGGAKGDVRRAILVWNGMRDGTARSAQVCLGDLVDAPASAFNIALAPGDVLFVSALPEEYISILGEVARPGVYPVRPDATVLDVIAAAGGLTPKADMGRVRVYQGSDVDGASTFTVASDRLLFDGDVQSNPKIAANQLIVVPSCGIRVHVTGSVGRPGPVELMQGATLADAVAAAGGLRPDADGRRSVLTRADGQGVSVSEVDVESFFAGRAQGAVPKAQDGDSVFVPEFVQQALVLGEVARPGAYKLPRGAKLADAVAAAGGLTARASLENVTIYAGGDAALATGAAIGQGKALFAGDGTTNPTLGPDDVVIVGSRMISVTVVGAAARPGVYELAAGSRLLDAVAAAGGVSAPGDAKSAVLTRADQGTDDGTDDATADGTSESAGGHRASSAGIDLDALARDPRGEANTVLAEADVVYIPEAPEKLKKQVAVLGAVARPGVYPVDEGTRLMEAVAAAGGPLDAADLARVKVYRGGEPADGLDLEVAEDRLVYDGGIKDNPVVEPSSVIVVPGGEVRVYVAGFVARPGQIALRRGATALDAIAAAGGVTSTGDGTRVSLVRKSLSSKSAVEIDITSALGGGFIGAGDGVGGADASSADADDAKLDGALVLMEEGDALFVPEAPARQIAVIGEVARPGVYPVRPNTTLIDVLAAAGGPTGKADLAGVKVYEGRGGEAALGAQAGDADGRPGDLNVLSPMVADESLVYEGNIKSNPPIMPGQVVVVPSSGIRVQVAGYVQRPGSYELKRGASIIEAITAAGGISTAANGAKVVVTRRGGEGDGKGSTDGAEGSSNAARAMEIDADAILAGGAISLELADGDTVYVPELAGQVVVLGEVARPGAYRLPRGAKLADAVAAAGGLTARASLENVTIYAGGDASVGTGAAIGQGNALFAGDRTSNPTLGPDDVVIVGSRMINVTVVGAAARPGVYELAAGARLLDAVAAAGGVLAVGDAKHVVLTRAADERATDGGRETATGVDLDSLAHNPKGEANTALADGDVVYIPEAPEKLKKQVAVLGAVARTGVYPVDEGTRLMEAIAAAGGPLDAADLARVKVYLGGEPAGGVDLEVSDDRLVYDGDIKANPVVEPSSVIVVPGTEVRVYVAGFVARPGQVTLRRGATALDARAAAGGVASAGDGTRVALARKAGDGAFSLEIDVTSALDAREAPGKPPVAPLPVLEDGDALFIPEAVPGQVLVLGEVARPGPYRLTQGARVLDLIAAAGGVTPKASLEEVSVFSEGVLAEPHYISIGAGKSLMPEGAVDNPEVRAGDVIVVASRMITVNVIGAVARPGTFEIQPGASVVDAVAAAGGTRADADAARVSVARRPARGAAKSEVLTVDLEAAIGGAGANGAAVNAETRVLLADGDVIFVPETQGQVLVLGEVARPGAYKLWREARLLDAIAAAGGTTAKASLESVTVYKDGALAAGTAEPLGHGKVLFSGKVTENPRVNPGDVVTVGSRMMNVSVIGRAARPGSYELPAGARVIDAVAAAGGVAADGDRRSVLVIPAGKSGPSTTVDLDQALRGGDVGYILSDGDVVFIPDTRQQVAVMGEVARPGVYAYTEGITLMEVMAMAGGPSTKADLDRVRLYRGERVEDALRLEVADDRLSFEGDIKQNPRVAPGDILFVPSGRIRVQVAGHIARTGEVELRRGATVLDAISAAGGLAQTGDGARVMVTRRGEGAGRVFEVDVDGLLRGGLPQAEAPGLEDGDVVFVPEANRKIAVMGGVARPGLYDYKTGMKLIEGLAMAGGPTAAARLDRVMVYSGDQAVQIALGDAKAKALTIDPTRGNNPELKSGDIIIVPLSDKIDWNTIIAILSAINQIKGIITR